MVYGSRRNLKANKNLERIQAEKVNEFCQKTENDSTPEE